MKQWLKDAVLYEIYPQSFYDTNGDGIGDLQGIIAKLDYIRDLGCNALWINPCFDSPFKDAGYDVRDYKKIAPRYGTNEDAAALFRAAHEKGIRVLFDLVPGHTSEEHPWFKASCKPGHTEYSDRFIWTDSCFASGDGMPFIGGETERNGTYILNFFKCQPALNYGYGKINEKWQKPTDDPACVATVEAMMYVKRFWLDIGGDGFRGDMAMLVPPAFWREAARQLRGAKSDLFLLAEAEERCLFDERAFDACYGWELFHLLNDVALQKVRITAVRDWLRADRGRYPREAIRLLFTSNHDENSWSGTEFARMGAAAEIMAAFTYVAEGFKPLVYTGQEVG